MNHIPCHFITSGYPMVFPDGLVTFYTDEVLTLSSQITVHFSSSNFYFFIFSKTTGCIFYNCKSSRKHIIQRLFIFLKNFFLQFINLSENRFAFLDICFFDSSLQFFYLFILLSSRFFDIFFQLFGFGTQLIVTQFSNLRIDFFYFIYPRLNFFHIASSLISKKFAYKFIKSHCILLFLLFLN